MADSFTLTQQVNATPAEAYRAFTNGPALAEWWCDWAFLAPFGGSTLYMYWETGFHAMGQFTEQDENRRLAFTWVTGGAQDCRAEITLDAAEGGTRVTLAYHDIASPDQARELERHWRAGLENLASVLETGEDLRITRKPMLGVLLGGLVDGKTADRYGTPHGIILGGVLDGLSAEAAGLQGDDVLVEADGVVLDDFEALSRVLSGRTTGDSVEVTYLRGGERQTAVMVLKARPIPDLPATPDALADRLAAIYASLNPEYEALLADVDDRLADLIPADGEWSIRQIAAHLIAFERDLQVTISMRAGGFGQVPSYYNNSLIRIQPIIAVYPTLADLRAEWARCQVQTVGAARSLPPEFTARRGSFRRLAWNLIEDQTSHPQDHFEQIRQIKEGEKAR